MITFPSIPITVWFSVLYHYHEAGIDTQGSKNIAMVFVGVVFVINSLIRLYTDNMGMTVKRLGKFKYIALNVVALSLLTLLFKQNFLQIQWVGVLVIGLFFACAAYIAYSKVKTVSNIDSSPKDNKIDYTKIESAS